MSEAAAVFKVGRRFLSSNAQRAEPLLFFDYTFLFYKKREN
jgi:hypothetical protein